MDLKIVTPVDSTARSAAISRESQNRQGEKRGRGQQSPDSYKPKAEKKEAGGFDKFFASIEQKPVAEASEFELMLKKVWEDNIKMQESAKVVEKQEETNSFENAFVWGISGYYRPIIRK